MENTGILFHIIYSPSISFKRFEALLFSRLLKTEATGREAYGEPSVLTLVWLVVLLQAGPLFFYSDSEPVWSMVALFPPNGWGV